MPNAQTQTVQTLDLAGELAAIDKGKRQFLLGWLVFEHMLGLAVLSIPTMGRSLRALDAGLILSQIALIATWQSLSSLPKIRRHLIAGIMYGGLVMAMGFYLPMFYLIAVIALQIQACLWFMKRRGFYVKCLAERNSEVGEMNHRLAILDLILAQVLVALIAFIFRHTDHSEETYFTYYRLLRMAEEILPITLICTMITLLAAWICLSPDKYNCEKSNNYAVLISIALFLTLLIPEERAIFFFIQLILYGTLMVARRAQYRIVGPCYKKTTFRDAWPVT